MTNRTSTRPYEISTADRAVGLSVVVFMLLLFGGIILQYQEINIGKATISYHAISNHSYGIAQGGDIRLSGISIGQIEDIELGVQSGVRIDLSIQGEYQKFITEGSYLEVDSSIGLGSIIGGSGLRFIPNKDSTKPIADKSEIKLIPPVDLAGALSAVELKKISDDIKELLHNVNTITATIAENQEDITTSMGNMVTITDELREAVRVVPEMSKTIKQGFSAWGDAGKTVSETVSGSRENFEQTLSKTHLAADKLNTTISELQTVVQNTNRLVKKLDESATRLPSVLSEGKTLIRNANKVTKTLNDHWLFGSGPDINTKQLPGAHPGDKSLYK